MHTLASTNHDFRPANTLARAIAWWRPHCGLAGVLLVAACLLRPMVGSGQFIDDMPNSCTAGSIALSAGSLRGCIENYQCDWMVNGRFFPLAIVLTYGVQACLFTALPYKCYLLALVLSNLIEFYVLLRLWRLPPAAAQLGTLALALIVQLRIFADPVLSFAGIMQVAVSGCLLSAICLQLFLDSGRRRWLVASTVSFVTALATYETSYCFLPVLLVMAYARLGRWSTTLAATRMLWLATSVLVAYTLGLRAHLEMGGSHPYGFNLVPSAIFNVAWRQSSAALPLSYALLSPYRVEHLNLWRLIHRPENWAVLLLAAGLTLALCRSLNRTPWSTARLPLKWMLACGLMAWIFPGLPIAFSSKYQEWIRDAGIGYLPVYAQYFGVGMLLAAALAWLAMKLPRALTVVMVMANACVALVTFDTNRAVVEALDAKYETRARQNVEAALAAGVCAQVPEGATIVTTRWRPWLFDGPPLSSALFTQFVQRRVQVVNADPGKYTRTLDEQLAGLERPSFIAVERTLGEHGGYMLVAPLQATAETGLAAASSDTMQSMLPRDCGIRTFRLYVRGGLESATGNKISPGRDCQPALPLEALTAEPAPRRIGPEMLTTVSSGSGWVLYEGCFPTAVYPTTLELGPRPPRRRPAWPKTVADWAPRALQETRNRL